MIRLTHIVLCALLPLCPALGVSAQQPPASFEATPRFPFAEGPLTLRQPALPNHPFTVTGKRGAILGMQDGDVEVWQLPVKLFSHLHLRAEVEGYPVTIDLNPLAAEIEVSPDHTTLTYSHAAITVRQHMFVPAGEAKDDLGGIIVFEIESIHPATLTVSLSPTMVREWPAPQWGQPGWDWHPMGSGGAYVLSTDNPELFGMVGMPNATPGPVSPYQEHPQTLPVEFRVHFDPARDMDRFFPLLTAVGRPGEANDAAGISLLGDRMVATASALPGIYRRTQSDYAHFFDHRTVVHTPDPRFDLAMRWAELAIDKSQATTIGGETGLVAGWYPSFDSARPGFGWFFGRDTLWSMYAIDSYGDDALARTAFEFLIKRQRADGKVMHEFSQTASLLTGAMSWDKLPYEYAAADATPLFLLAMQDYVRATGDVPFLRAHWDAVERAYRFERTHDSDGDGVYDNAQGTGWVEGWPPKLPHQELYLAALDRDATRAMVQLATWVEHGDVAAEATATAGKLTAAVAAYQLPNQRFAFSKNTDGTYDPTQTVYPSVALWSSGRGLPHPDTMLQAWSAHEFETDWGTRAVATSDPVYDPISYHQGSVWPLFTGWTTMAQYRAERPLAGYAALRRNVDLTWAQDPGAVTEVLSGRFYEPLGRSSTHQLWSSAMVLAPALRELFGLEPDAVAHTLLVHPHLPPGWNEVTLEHVRVDGTELAVTESRRGAQLHVSAASEEPGVLCLRADAELAAVIPACHEPASKLHGIDLPLPALELALHDEGLPIPGAETEQARVIDEHYTKRATVVLLEARAGTTVMLEVHRNGAAARGAHTTDGILRDEGLTVTMPPGTGFVTKQVSVTW